MDKSKQLEDGSHHIVVKKCRFNGCEEYERVTGNIQWNPYEGVSFEFEYPDVSQPELINFFRPIERTGRTGQISKISDEADWIGETDEGLEFRLYGTNNIPRSKQYYGSEGTGNDSSISGSAVFAEVEFQKSSELSFWNSTPEINRLFFQGFSSYHWSEQKEISYTVEETKTTTTRCHIVLLPESETKIYAAGSRLIIPSCGWFTSLDFPKPRVQVFSLQKNFMSLLNGRRTQFYWHDHFIDTEKLIRTYHGFVRVDKNNICSEGRNETLPLRDSIEAMKHGKDVVDHLPSLYSQLGDKSEYIDFSWILNPLWMATNCVLDDQLALASISLERLTTEWTKEKKRRFDGSKKKAADEPIRSFVKDIQNHLQSAFEDKLQEIDLEENQFSEQITIIQKKLENLHQKPNSDKLVEVFAENNIELTDPEHSAIDKRNESLHGRRTLKGTSPPELNEEAEQFDLLRMLITKAVLSILEYAGPYINYAARPEDGNFPIEYLSTV